MAGMDHAPSAVLRFAWCRSSATCAMTGRPWWRRPSGPQEPFAASLDEELAGSGLESRPFFGPDRTHTVWQTSGWIALLVVAILLGIIRQVTLLTAAGVLGLTLSAAQVLWLRRCLDGVEYQRRLGASRAFWGDEVSLGVRIANHKLLPLSWLMTSDRMPDRLPLEGAQLVTDPGGWSKLLKHLVSLLPYGRVLLEYRLRCHQRGVFDFGPVRLESGDLLGYGSRETVVPAVDRLLIYPKLFELDLPPPASRRTIGPQRADRIILTDPSRTIGVRGYQPGDPLRNVEWRASARGGQLLVRQFEPTTDPGAAIFLNSDPPTLEWGYYDPPELEFCISLTASLARWMLDRGYPVGVFGNGEPIGSNAVRLPISNHPEQLQRILETLALASPFGPVQRRVPEGWIDPYATRLDERPSWRLTLGQMMLRESPRLPFEASVVVVTTKFDVDLLAACREMQRKRPLRVLYVQTPDQPIHPNISGIDICTIPYDADWLTRDRFQLAA